MNEMTWNNFIIYSELYQIYSEVYQTYPKLCWPNRRGIWLWMKWWVTWMMNRMSFWVISSLSCDSQLQHFQPTKQPTEALVENRRDKGGSLAGEATQKIDMHISDGRTDNKASKIGSSLHMAYSYESCSNWYLQGHWTVATVDIQNNSINYYDSFHGRNPRFLTELKKFFAAHYEGTLRNAHLL